MSDVDGGVADGVRRRTSATVIVPTLREATGVGSLFSRVNNVRRESGLDLDVLIVDDDSGDEIESVVRRLGLSWARVHLRRGERGLASAVLAGIALAKRDTIVVMDADLSHPPEKIPELLAALDHGAEMAVGSRYVAGGTTDAEWTLWRRVNSGLATLLARLLTTICDPMSGMIAFDRATLARAGSEGLRPMGYKIALEIIVRARLTRVVEVPIHFTERRVGVSKLSIGVQAAYLRQVTGLLMFRVFDRKGRRVERR